MKKRGEAEISTTWRLEDMVPNNETWERKRLTSLKHTGNLRVSWQKKQKIYTSV